MWDGRNSPDAVPDGGAVVPYPAYEAARASLMALRYQAIKALQRDITLQRVDGGTICRGVGIVAVRGRRFRLLNALFMTA